MIDNLNSALNDPLIEVLGYFYIDVLASENQDISGVVTDATTSPEAKVRFFALVGAFLQQAFLVVLALK